MSNKNGDKRGFGPAASRLGITVDEYLAHLARGDKWCYRCRDWHSGADQQHASPIEALKKERERLVVRLATVDALIVSYVEPTLCECGCGAPAPISTETSPRKGRVRGRQLRFLQGHNGRLRNPGYTVDEATGCWNWNGYVSSAGYGGNVAGPGGRAMSAHRAYYVRARGPIPEGLALDHLCRNKRCVNPDHLEVVTPAENNRRASTTKLSADDVATVRAEARRGNHASLARRFGVSRSLISMVAEGKRWATT